MRAFPASLLLFSLACAAPPAGTSAPDASDDGTGQPAPDAGEAAPDAGEQPAPDAGNAAPDAGSVDAGTPVTVLTGVLVGGPGPYPGAIAGVQYASGSTSGVTDASGTFRYESGHSVTFSTGDVLLAQVAGAPKRTPFALADDAGCAANDALRRVLVLLESLDADHDPTNGLALPAFPTSAPTRYLSNLSDADFAAFLAPYANGTAVDPAAALDRFITQIDGETWAETSMQTFSQNDSALRSQGIASDGVNVWFSWRFGLQITDLQFNTGLKNNLAIPLQYSNPFSASPSDHIGDIDVFGDTLYVPVEDSKRYEHPRVLLYSKDQLDWKNVAYDLPANLLTKGVPWVCVDGPAQVAYAAEWDPTTSVLEFNLADFQLKRQLPLRRTLGRIQGAKVFDGMLYFHADDAQKAVYKVNRDTGTVITLVSGTWQGEQEGLAFFSLPDGTTMHAANATPDASAMELHHLTRTRAPLRDEVCPGG